MNVHQDPKIIIADWGNELLKRHNVKPQEAARRARVSPATIHRLLGRDPNYHDTPSSKTVGKLASAFNEAPPSASGLAFNGLHEPELLELKPEDKTSDANFKIEGKHNQTQFRINTRALQLAGYMPGDIVLVDLNLKPKSGDLVCAQIYDLARGTAETVLRIYQPPYLLAATADPGLAWLPQYVDNEKVKIMGTAIKSVRTRTA